MSERQYPWAFSDLKETQCDYISKLKEQLNELKEISSTNPVCKELVWRYRVLLAALDWSSEAMSNALNNGNTKDDWKECALSAGEDTVKTENYKANWVL